MHRLTVDASYWSYCTGTNPSGTTANGPSQTDAVNQWWRTGTGTDPRRWANLPDNSGQYTVEEIPANGRTACSPSDPVNSLIDTDTATFRVRITGRALGPTLQPMGPKRSILATFKRKSFLDYIYFTDFEILDPTLYAARFLAGSSNTKENVETTTSTPPAAHARAVGQPGLRAVRVRAGSQRQVPQPAVLQRLPHPERWRLLPAACAVVAVLELAQRVVLGSEFHERRHPVRGLRQRERTDAHTTTRR